MAKSSLHFEVHPSVVYQLGESLISDAMQAIIELVKNSYDADASYSKVVIDTQGVTKLGDSYYKDEKGGIISIEDDGCGMSLDDIRNGWLTISNRQKLEIKRKKKTTKKGRTPLGDKGLGRLGVQKLGKNIEIYTKRERKEGYHIGFSWVDFLGSEKLENVTVQYDEISYPKSSGTKIVISGLMEPELWEEKEEKTDDKLKVKKKIKDKQKPVIELLKNELSKLISPYKEIRDFTVYIEINGNPIDLIEISDSIRNSALLKYKINFDGKKLFITGTVKLDYFLPQKREEASLFQNIVRKDNGRRFFSYLEKQNFARGIKLTRSKTMKWFVDFVYKRTFSDIDKVEYIDENKIANPGSFFGEVDAFNLNFYDEDKNIFDQKSEYRDIIKKMSGIRVYRDSFAIRVDEDWLGLGKQQTIGSSFYGLRPLNTLGFISLTARDNIDLEETTDREGFKNTIYYRNFFLLLQQFVKFTGDAQENLRRSWNEFRKKHIESISDVKETDTLEDMTKTMETVINNAPVRKKTFDKFGVQISKSKPIMDKIKVTLKESEISSELRKQADDLLNQFKDLLDESTTALNQGKEYLSELDSLKGLPGIIDERIKDLYKKMEIMYETAALGLTAEALSHEINNIIDQLAIRVKAIKIDLSKKGITEKNILIFIEYVNSAIHGLQKQMSFLSPTLRYVREKRNVIVIKELINEIIGYFKERWGDEPIIINIVDATNENFLVRINKGKLIQIVDNLLLNSEYWLKEDIKQEKIKKGIINIDISAPYIYISDNGRGIDPSVEFTLFDSFVSTKANGRGLGLFIVKKLLATEGCDIELLPDRNKKKHLFKFRLDLGGIINE
jgi:signal transduction histidine kinase